MAQAKDMVRWSLLMESKVGAGNLAPGREADVLLVVLRYAVTQKDFSAKKEKFE